MLQHSSQMFKDAFLLMPIEIIVELTMISMTTVFLEFFIGTLCENRVVTPDLRFFALGLLLYATLKS